MRKRADAFRMPSVVWSRRFAGGQRDMTCRENAAIPLHIANAPQEVAERCDVRSVHLALTGETGGLVNASVLDKLRSGSYFINTARAEVVDYAALAIAVRDRSIRVALDVFAGEPKEATGAFTDAIVSLPNVY